MANVADLNLIQIKDFPEVTNPSEWIVVSDAAGTAYKISKENFKDFLGTVTVTSPKPIGPTDGTPELDGIYIPTVVGAYPNMGGLERLESDGYVQFLKNGSVFAKVNTPMPQVDTSGLATKEEVSPLIAETARLTQFQDASRDSYSIIEITKSILKAADQRIVTTGAITTGAGLTASAEYQKLPDNWSELTITLPLSGSAGLALYGDVQSNNNIIFLKYYVGNASTLTTITITKANFISEFPELGIPKYFRTTFNTAQINQFKGQIKTTEFGINTQQLANEETDLYKQGIEISRFDKSILQFVGAVSGSVLNPSLTTFRSSDYIQLPEDWIYIEYLNTNTTTAAIGLKFFDESKTLIISISGTQVYSRRVYRKDVTPNTKPYFIRITALDATKDNFFLKIATPPLAHGLGKANIRNFEYNLTQTKVANPIMQSFETMPSITKETVFGATDNPSKPYARIPAVIVTNAGTVLVASELRTQVADTGEFDLVLKRKTSGSSAWQTNNIFPFTAGTYGRAMNPSFVIDRTGVHGVTGRIYLFVLAVLNPAKYAIDSTTAELDCIFKYSDDDGATFSAPESIKSKWDTTKYRGAGPSPANGIQMADGTLVVPSFNVVAPYVKSGLFYKKVGGDWIFSEPTQYVRDNESTVVETPDNKLILNVRTDPTVESALRVRSVYEFDFATNSFKYHWTDKTFNAIVQCQASLDSITISGRKIYLFTHPDAVTHGQSPHSNNRRNITVWASVDLHRWIRVYRAYTPVAWGYSVINHHNGKLVIVYEAVGVTIEYQDISAIIPIIQESVNEEWALSTEDRLQNFIIKVRKDDGEPFL